MSKKLKWKDGVQTSDGYEVEILINRMLPGDSGYPPLVGRFKKESNWLPGMWWDDGKSAIPGVPDIVAKV